MVDYVSRSEWTSTNASGDTLTGSKLRGVAVHWPGTSQDEIGTSGIESRLRGYRDYHVGTRGWRDIGYNFAIDQAGRVYMLRSTAWHGNMVGAHCASGANPDANHEYVGVLLLLGDEEVPSARMVDAFQHWYHRHFLPHWRGRTDVRGHRQVFGAQTSCPGDRALAAIDDMTREPEEDDMPSPKDWDRKDWDAFEDHVYHADWRQDRMLAPRQFQNDDGTNVHMPESILRGGNYWAWVGGNNSNRALAELAAIRKAMGADVDEIVAEVAALVVSGILDALDDSGQAIDTAAIVEAVKIAMREGTAPDEDA